MLGIVPDGLDSFQVDIGSALDREHAEQRVEEILAEYHYERLDLKAYPGGFRIVMTYLQEGLKVSYRHFMPSVTF